jgi:hypothetical protein
VSSFIDETIRIYERFLKKIRGTPIVIGVNPTAIKDTQHIFGVNFKDPMCNDNNKIQEVGELVEEKTYDSLAHIYNDSIEKRNQALFLMNDVLKTMCIKNRWAFIDMMPILNENGILAERFQKPCLDHHIKPLYELSKYLSDRLNDIILGGAVCS